MFTSDWCSEWHGWGEFASGLCELSLGSDDADIAVFALLQSTLKRFLCISCADQDLPLMFCEDRLDELQRGGYALCRSNVYGRNDCLADPLLQLMCCHSILPHLSTNVRDMVCRANRLALMRNENVRVRPRERHPLICADEGVVWNAFLQHDVHAEFTVKFFLSFFGRRLVDPCRSATMCVKVFCWFDFETLPHSVISLFMHHAFVRGDDFRLEFFCLITLVKGHPVFITMR